MPQMTAYRPIDQLHDLDQIFWGLSQKHAKENDHLGKMASLLQVDWVEYDCC